MSREQTKRFYGCTVDFTITAKGESLRQYHKGRGHKALTRDVVCAEYPGVEVRRDGQGGYVCQYRLSKTIALYMAGGSGMGQAAALGLGMVCRCGWDAKALRKKAMEQSRKGKEDGNGK